MASATFQAIDAKLKLSYLLMISKLLIVITPTESLPRSSLGEQRHHRPEAIQFKETCKEIQDEIESIITDKTKWSNLDTTIAEEAVRNSTRKIEILQSLLDDYIRDNSEAHRYIALPSAQRGPYESPSFTKTIGAILARPTDEDDSDAMMGGGDEDKFVKNMKKLYSEITKKYPCDLCSMDGAQLKKTKKKKKATKKKKKPSKKKKKDTKKRRKP